MVQCIMQFGVCIIENPEILQYFHTNDGMMQYYRLRYNINNDTVFYNTYLHRNDSCVQILAINFQFWISLCLPLENQG